MHCPTGGGDETAQGLVEEELRSTELEIVDEGQSAAAVSDAPLAAAGDPRCSLPEERGPPTEVLERRVDGSQGVSLEAQLDRGAIRAVCHRFERRLVGRGEAGQVELLQKPQLGAPRAE